jgi:site-specific recombinase XerC
MNVELKEIGKGINKKLQEQGSNERFPENVSTNWARHSWATIARNDCKINKDDVALCLGHEDSDNKVTDIYIKYDYSIIDGSNRMVIDKLVQKKDRKTAKTVEMNKEKRA